MQKNFSELWTRPFHATLRADKFALVFCKRSASDVSTLENREANKKKLRQFVVVYGQNAKDRVELLRVFRTAREAALFIKQCKLAQVEYVEFRDRLIATINRGFPDFTKDFGPNTIYPSNIYPSIGFDTDIGENKDFVEMKISFKYNGDAE